MFIGVPGATVVLLPDGTAEALPDALVGADDAEIAEHYGVDEVVHPPKLPWCRGVILDGPDAGMEVYVPLRHADASEQRG